MLILILNSCEPKLNKSPVCIVFAVFVRMIFLSSKDEIQYERGFFGMAWKMHAYA